jgi:hypothetical protein
VNKSRECPEDFDQKQPPVTLINKKILYSVKMGQNKEKVKK